MKFPKKVWVGPYKYKIRKGHLVEDAYGVTDNKLRTIRISYDALGDKDLRTTLLHEIEHAILSVSGYSWRWIEPGQVLPRPADSEENYIRQTEAIRFQVLTDPRNRVVWDYILQR